MVDLVLSIPASSSEVERGLNQLKLVKQTLQTLIPQETLTDLMAIKMLSGRDIDEFDTIPEINLWATGGVRPRRPFAMDSEKGRSTVIAHQNETTVIDDVSATETSVTEEKAHDMLLSIC